MHYLPDLSLDFHPAYHFVTADSATQPFVGLKFRAGGSGAVAR